MVNPNREDGCWVNCTVNGQIKFWDVHQLVSSLGQYYGVVYGSVLPLMQFFASIAFTSLAFCNGSVVPFGVLYPIWLSCKYCSNALDSSVWCMMRKIEKHIACAALVSLLAFATFGGNFVCASPRHQALAAQQSNSLAFCLASCLPACFGI